jgi:hypothetical protein
MTAEQPAKEFADVKENQRQDAVGAEFCALRLPNWWLSPHTETPFSSVIVRLIPANGAP